MPTNIPDIGYIHSVFLELLASVLNNKTIPVMPKWWPATEKFLKRSWSRNKLSGRNMESDYLI